MPPPPLRSRVPPCHRRTQYGGERTALCQIRAQKRALAGHYIASEDLLLEESMGEAYTKLVMPLPVGESQKNMERQRKRYANGELKAPVPYPEVWSRDLRTRTGGSVRGHCLSG